MITIWRRFRGSFNLVRRIVKKSGIEESLYGLIRKPVTNYFSPYQHQPRASGTDATQVLEHFKVNDTRTKVYRQGYSERLSL